MGETKGFLKYSRQNTRLQPVEKRIKNYNEFVIRQNDETLSLQGARCMDCGTPFCHSSCPVYNLIPDWNDLVYRGKWKEAAARLLMTNNFPEFTGRVCPALCENSCVLAINDDAVAIKNIELAIIEKAFAKKWIKPSPPKTRSGKNVAVIGSGPAGLACADQLNKSGHTVTVFEKSDRPGGLLSLGIPDFKMEKRIVARRIKLMQAEGVVFRTGCTAGVDISAEQLRDEFHAVVLCTGASRARDINVPGRHLRGIHFALDFLTQQNIINSGGNIGEAERISAQGKHVIVLGGGDTGSDCIGIAIRQGARSVKNFELLPAPPHSRSSSNPWPQWAKVERISTSHIEGCSREYSVMTKGFEGSENCINKLNAVRLEFEDGKMAEAAGSEFSVETDMVILALGFTGTEKAGIFQQLDVEFDERGNVKTGVDKMTNVPGVFAAGDLRRGQSLIVWAIREGRDAADAVNNYL